MSILGHGEVALSTAYLQNHWANKDMIQLLSNRDNIISS